MSNSLGYPNKKCTFAYRVVRRSKSQNISALALSLNRYHKSATPSFQSDTQSDISFLIIRGKDSARREQRKEKPQDLFSLPSRSLSSRSKVVQGESKEKPKVFNFPLPSRSLCYEKMLCHVAMYQSWALACPNPFFDIKGNLPSRRILFIFSFTDVALEGTTDFANAGTIVERWPMG